MGVNFEFNFEELDNNELRINGRRTDSYGVAMWDSIIIKKEWISWIITTLRNLAYEDYNTWQKGIENDYEDCELIILMYLFENRYSYIKILPFWKDEERITPAIEIPYLSWNKRLLMSEFIEPFLVALSQFLTEEERGKLPENCRPPGVKEKKKRKGKRREKKMTNPTTEEFQYGLQAKLIPEIISVYGMRIMTYTRSNRREAYWNLYAPHSRHNNFVLPTERLSSVYPAELK